MDKDIVFEDDSVKATEKDDNLEILYKKPNKITLDKNDRKDMDNELIRMLRLRLEDDKKFITQEKIGKIFGISRQMVNRRWQVYKQDGLLALLSGREENFKITPELLRRLEEISVENPFLSASDIKKILISEKLCDDISEASIYSAQRQMDGRRIVELLRKKESKNIPQELSETGYLIGQLLKMIEDLFDKVPPKKKEEVLNNSLYNYLKPCLVRVAHHDDEKKQKRGL
ncbi:MAG: hypothetical protein DRP84_06155 [Spirochaetes bacterium]|nr:MAG: hypothetical protein DRP84_06155 [Spirochaetota bacterium]